MCSVAAGALVSLYASYQTKRQNDQINAVQQQNFRNEAAARRDIGMYEAARIRDKAARTQSQAIMQEVGSGFSPFSGSFADINAGILATGELDAKQAELNASLGIMGIRSQASAAEGEYNLQRLRSQYGMGSTVLTSMSALYSA